MKNTDIQKLTVYQFVRELTEDNFNYIHTVYSSFEGALDVYKENSQESGKDEYLDINHYFEIDQRNWEDINSQF